jgi:hypothetical protein
MWQFQQSFESPPQLAFGIFSVIQLSTRLR